MMNIGWAEMFHRLFRAAWLPGQGQSWRVWVSLNGVQQVAPTLPIDGLLLDLIVFIIVLLLIDWMLKCMRRYDR